MKNFIKNEGKFMNIMMERHSIVSVTDLVKNFASIRQKAKEGSNMFVFKNNKPDLVILDIDEYAKLLETAELLENLSIIKMVEERDKNDNGVLYTSDDVTRMRNQHREREQLSHV